MLERPPLLGTGLQLQGNRSTNPSPRPVHCLAFLVSRVGSALLHHAHSLKTQLLSLLTYVLTCLTGEIRCSWGEIKKRTYGVVMYLLGIKPSTRTYLVGFEVCTRWNAGAGRLRRRPCREGDRTRTWSAINQEVDLRNQWYRCAISTTDEWVQQ